MVIVVELNVVIMTVSFKKKQEDISPSAFLLPLINNKNYFINYHERGTFYSLMVIATVETTSQVGAFNVY